MQTSEQNPVTTPTPTPPIPVARLHYAYGPGALKHHGPHLSFKLDNGQVVTMSPGQTKYVHPSAHGHPDVAKHPRIKSKLLPDGIPSKGK
jgi:hypothetical protein